MFCDKLKMLRKEKGLTQEELAKTIYVSRSVIAKYETNAAYPNEEILEKLALFFNVKIEDLIGNEKTTLTVTNSKSVGERLNFVCLVFVAIFSFFLSVFIFLPVFQGSRYDYPVEIGQTPERENFYASIFTGTFNEGNMIGLVSFLITLFTGAIAVLSLFYKEKKYAPFLCLASYVLFVGNLVLFFISIVVCFSYIT